MSIREYMIAPFSSANSEVFTLICCGLILFIVMVLTFMVVVVTVKNTKRHNQVVRNLKIYMTEHLSGCRVQWRGRREPQPRLVR